MTPRQFHLLLDRHREKVEHQELLNGIVASAIANWSMHKLPKPLSAADFMPSRFGRREEEPRVRINRKRIAAHVRAFLDAQMKRHK